MGPGMCLNDSVQGPSVRVDDYQVYRTLGLTIHIRHVADEARLAAHAANVGEAVEELLGRLNRADDHAEGCPARAFNEALPRCTCAYAPELRRTLAELLAPMA